jgi:phospholipid/cholesterol/gamma-HCH transport system substrate-binding protein
VSRPRSNEWPPPARPYLIGIGLLVAVLVVCYAAFKQSVPFVSGYRVEAVFQSSSGLRNGSPVRIAGVDVGKVIGVRRGPGHTTIVTMKLEQDGRPVHADATARIRPRVFLEGGYMVELTAGSPGAPELPDDGTIPLAQTSVPVQFHDLLTVFEAPARESLRTALSTTREALAGGGARGLRTLAPELRPLLRDTAWVAEAMTGTGRDDLTALVRAGERVARALDRDGDRLGRMVDHLATFAESLRSRDAELTASIRQLDGLLREAPAATAALDRALPVVEGAARQVTPALGVAPAALGETADVMGRLGRLVAPSRRERTLLGLQTAFVDLPAMVGELAGVFPSARPLASCLSSHVVPTLEAVAPDGALTSGRPVWQDFAHALVGLSSASQNFDGNGHALRYQFGIGDQSVSTLNLPGIGPLLATAPSSLQSRPLPRADLQPPPFNTDAPCADQPPVNLETPAGPAGLGPARGARRGYQHSLPELAELLSPRSLRRVLAREERR